MKTFAGALLLFGLAIPADAQDANVYFGHVEAPCAAGKSGCNEFINDIKALGTSCLKIDQPCENGEKVVSKLFGKTYRRGLPDFLVYLEQKRSADGKRVEFAAHQPVLMYGGNNTPHLYGVRDIYAIVFSEHKACIDGFVSTDYKSEPNPFSAIFSVAGKDISPDKAKDSARNKMEFSWFPLSGDPTNSPMWYAVGRTQVDVNSQNRITVRTKQPAAPKDDDEKEEKAKPKPGAKPKPNPKPKPEGLTDPCAPEGDEAPVYAADFNAANGFFSNSPDSYVTFALAVGATFNAKDTQISSGGSEIIPNAYALAKWYLVRPQLHAGPTNTGHRLSWGLFVGTNLSGSVFKEFVAGVSLGHVIGNTGFLLGVNSIEGKDGTDQGRQRRLFVGLDYSF